MHAKRGNVIGVTGQAAKAVLEEAHAILCERGHWALNEKRLIEAADLRDMQPLFTRVLNEPAELALWVERIARALGAT